MYHFLHPQVRGLSLLMQSTSPRKSLEQDVSNTLSHEFPLLCVSPSLGLPHDQAYRHLPETTECG